MAGTEEERRSREFVLSQEQGAAWLLPEQPAQVPSVGLCKSSALSVFLPFVLLVWPFMNLAARSQKDFGTVPM